MNGPLGRIIFPLFVLTMWVLFATWLVQGEWTWLNWLMLGSAAVIVSMVFVEFAAVFSIGYSLCMIVLPVQILIFRDLSTASVIVSGLALVYGLRLFVFVVRRRRAASFAGNARGAAAASAHIPKPIVVMVFLYVTTLQTFLAMSQYVVATDGRTTTWIYVGAAFMVIGLVVESVADAQKQKAKTLDNQAFVGSGLYARTRHPNYTGEIVFQVGLAVAAFGSFSGWWQLLSVVVAPAYIVVLMVFQAKEGTNRMAKRHAGDPEFDAYVAGSGLLLPGRGRSLSRS